MYEVLQVTRLLMLSDIKIGMGEYISFTFHIIKFDKKILGLLRIVLCVQIGRNFNRRPAVLKMRK